MFEGRRVRSLLITAVSNLKGIMQSVKLPLLKKLCLLTIGSSVLLIGLSGLLILIDKPTAILVDQLMSTALDTTEETIDRATIEDYARIKLPQGATHIHAHTERGIDSLILLKFSLLYQFYVKLHIIDKWMLWCVLWLVA